MTSVCIAGMCMFQMRLHFSYDVAWVDKKQHTSSVAVGTKERNLRVKEKETGLVDWMGHEWVEREASEQQCVPERSGWMLREWEGREEQKGREGKEDVGRRWDCSNWSLGDARGRLSGAGQREWKMVEGGSLECKSRPRSSCNHVRQVHRGKRWRRLSIIEVQLHWSYKRLPIEGIRSPSPCVNVFFIGPRFCSCF